MHFHLPKPLHGWREFVGEVGIIVIGVLIALGAEQVVQTLDSRTKGNEAQSRIRDELGSDLLQGIERVAIHACLRDRLSALARGLASGRKDWSKIAIQPPKTPGLPTGALREIYHVPDRNWLEDAYREALARGDLNSVGPDQRRRLASIYKQFDSIADMNHAEHGLNTSLATLQFNLPLSNPERNEMLTTVARLDWINNEIVLASRQTFETFNELGYQMTPAEVAGWRKAWPSTFQGLRERYGPCVHSRAVSEFDQRVH